MFKAIAICALATSVSIAAAELPDPIFYPMEPGTYTFEVTFSSPIRTSEPARCTVVVTE